MQRFSASARTDSLGMNQTNLSAFIWSVADLLRGDYKPHEYGKVILPFTVLRRLDCVLAPTKAKVLAGPGRSHRHAGRGRFHHPVRLQRGRQPDQRQPQCRHRHDHQQLRLRRIGP